MNRRLLEFLVCPCCLPWERRLEAAAAAETEDEIVEGLLLCPHCSTRFPVNEGVASFLTGDVKEGCYENRERLSSYLWAHFADLWNDPDSLPSYSRWAELLPCSSAWGLDLGCAVGRLTFELAEKTPFAVGIDRSLSFVRAARRLLCHGRIKASIRVEGELFEEREVVCNPTWRRQTVEFIVADAMALPFRQETFGVVSSLNLLDRLPSPLGHLCEVDRVSLDRGSAFLVSDPFSWSSEYTPKDQWLGGRPDGKFEERGLVNLRRILERQEWGVKEGGSLWWKIRNHRNHFELIRSEYLVSAR